MVKRCLLLLIALSLMPTCKSNESSPPPPPPPTAQSITVNSSSDMLYIGIEETFTATATMSDGSTKAVTGGVWGGDNPSVATVEAGTGRVIIVGSGMVSIYVDYQGRRGAKVIRGLPNYQGTWVGSYYIVSCKSTGDYKSSNFCGSFPVNRVFPHNLSLTQDEDRVEGRFYLGTLGADASGPVQTDGQLQLTGAVKEGINTIEVGWTLQSKTAGRITGTLNQLWRATGYSGDGRLSCKIRDCDRTTILTTPTPPGMFLVPKPTLEDLIRALVGR